MYTIILKNGNAFSCENIYFNGDLQEFDFTIKASDIEEISE